MLEPDVKHLNLIVKGIVQGVRFRYHAKELAQQLELVGYARNMPDGSVYIEAEGDTKALNNFLELLKNSPGISVVKNIGVEKDEVKNYTQFSVY